MYNTILANSTPVGTPDFTNTGGAVSDNEQNIVELCQTGTDCSAFFSNADPGLGNLMTNDNGPTETRAIDSTSIAYNNADTASAPEYDQNGTPRDVNPDIGAYEVQVIDAIALIQNTSKEKCSAKDKGPFYLQVFDLNGRMITTEKYPGFLQTQNINSFLENSSKLNKSLYVIRLKNSQKVRILEFKLSLVSVLLCDLYESQSRKIVSMLVNSNYVFNSIIIVCNEGINI